MKLSEIKTSLIEQFFVDSSAGVPEDKLDEIVESIGHSLNVTLSSDVQSVLSQQSSHSSDPSKAFKRFTEGRLSILTVLEEDGSHANAIFAAVRVGRAIKIADLTVTPVTEKSADLNAVKQALRQAKNLNDDSYFNIVITDTL